MIYKKVIVFNNFESDFTTTPFVPIFFPAVKVFCTGYFIN